MTVIKVAEGNQNTMANYFPVVLSPTVQDWLTGLPANSINSWGDLCSKFIDNYQGTFMKPGVEWDLYQIAQKKNETLRDYIRWFMKKKNTIPGTSDPVVMASFRTGIRDPDLLKKPGAMTTKNGKRPLRYGRPICQPGGGGGR